MVEGNHSDDDTDGALRASNDDIDTANLNFNSCLSATLPTDGVYTVIVSDMCYGGGGYELVVR